MDQGEDTVISEDFCSRLLYFMIAIISILSLLLLISVPAIEPGSETYIIFILDIVIIGFLSLFTFSLFFYCRSRSP